MSEQFTKTYAPWVALASLLVTVTIALLQYQSAQRTQKINQTLEFLTAYNSKELLATKVHFILEFGAFRASFGEIKPDPDGSFHAYDQAVLRFLDSGSDTNSNSKISTEFEHLVAFYDTVAACANTDICDRELTKAYFFCDMYAFATSLYPGMARIWEHHRSDGLQTRIFLQAIPKKDRPSCDPPERPAIASAKAN
jgi:hypothetical protein